MTHITCDCGSIVTTKYHTKHIKTKKHLELMKKKEILDDKKKLEELMKKTEKEKIEYDYEVNLTETRPHNRYEFATKYKEAIICDLCHINIATCPITMPHKWNHVVCGECMVNVVVPDLNIRYNKNYSQSVIDAWTTRIEFDDNERRKIFEK